MAQNEQRDWKNEVSKQIVVYKTDKKLLELNDKLKPASKLFPAHIHAMGGGGGGGPLFNSDNHVGLQ